MLGTLVLHYILHPHILEECSQNKVIRLKTGIAHLLDGVDGETVAPDCIGTYSFARKRRYIGIHESNLLALLVEEIVLVGIGKSIYPVLARSDTLNCKTSARVGT